MKFVILGLLLFIVVTFSMRKRRENEARDKSGDPPRGASMYKTGDGAVNVRSADNVRLISDDQLGAVDGNRDKPVE
jgi:hypothetical protein